MAQLPKYHIGAQRADVLLAPIAASLQVEAARARHYASRLNLAAESDAPTLLEASRRLDEAAQALAVLIAARRAEGRSS